MQVVGDLASLDADQRTGPVCSRSPGVCDSFMNVQYRNPEEHVMEQVYLTDGERVVASDAPVVAVEAPDVPARVLGECGGEWP